MGVNKLNKLLCLVSFVIPSLLYGAVFINQVGYAPDKPKYVFVNQFADSFRIYQSLTQTLVYEGELTLQKSNDPATGLSLYVGDFSDLTQPGTYYCKISGDTSYSFTINDSVYFPVYKKSLKSFYFQRCGFDLLGPTAGNYYHSRCHQMDASYHTSTGFTGFHLARGGWHDAGDYGKYVVNAGITVGTLLMSYEYFPNLFDQDNLDIPESSNGVPDILDEIRYELEWMLKMQNTDGGVFHKLTREQFAPFIMPQNDLAPRYIYEISSAATADLAAVMARAVRVFVAIDSSFAQTCLMASLSAWDYLIAHPTIQPPGGFSNPSGTGTGVYGDSNDTDERLWAAAELYLTTGEDVYNLYYSSHYNQVGLITTSMSWQNVKNLAHIAYIKGSQTGINTAIQTTLRSSLESTCQDLINRHNNNGFFVTINPGEYYWGSNSGPLNNAILLIFGFQTTQNEVYQNAALDQLNYILGANALGMSYITGIGSLSPMHPHHRPSESDGVNDPVPGLLVGGPDEYLSDPILQSIFNSNTPPALCYVDDVGSYASNEIAINWNAPLVFLSGYFTREAITSIKDENLKGMIPKSIQLQQNYPNPFNSATRISFEIPERLKVRLEVYDIRGNQVKVLMNNSTSPGRHSVSFDAKDFSSGIYFYRLSTKYGQLNRKLILLK